MVLTVGFVLLVVAAVHFILGMVAVPSPPRWQWVPAGLLFMVLSMLLGGFRL